MVNRDWERKRERVWSPGKIVLFPLKLEEKRTQRDGRSLHCDARTERTGNEIPFARELEADEAGTLKCSWSHVTRSGHTNEVRSRSRPFSHRRCCVSALSFSTAGFFQPIGWTRTKDRSHASATRLRATQKPPSCTLHACRSEVVSCNHTHAYLSITIEMNFNYCNIMYADNYFLFSVFFKRVASFVRMTVNLLRLQ